MDALSITIETFACEQCGYYQNQDPFVEGIMSLMFPEFPGIQDGYCPACFSGRNEQRVRQVSMLTRLEGVDIPTTVTTASYEELETGTEDERDEFGNVILEQVGERETLGIVGGKPAVVTVPVYQPKQRERTKEEVSELKQKLHENLDKLNSLAVAEITPEPLDAPVVEADPEAV